MARKNRTHHERRVDRPEPPPRTPLQSARTGALIGAATASVALAVGAARIVLALVSGTPLTFDDMWRGLVFYVAGFVLAGTLVGYLLPTTRTRNGLYTLGIAGASVAMVTMMQGFWGPFWRWEGAMWFSAVMCSLIFGIVLARQLR